MRATLVIALIAGGSAASAAEPDAGIRDFVEYESGQLPIILTVPHGGQEKPVAIADRRTGERSVDRNTLVLAREISAELKRHTGRTPHFVASLLHRVKLDPNRDLAEAAEGDPGAEQAWRRFHACVDRAKHEAVTGSGFAFLIDVHGHAHPIARLELGYALYTVEINLPDAELDAGDAGRRSSLGHLQARSGRAISELIRGPASLGALLEQHGFAAIPSPAAPRPSKDPYYSGSYILRHHASAAFPGVDGFQLECPFNGVRDTPEDRARLARALVAALGEFLEIHYHYHLPTPSAPVDR